MIGGSQHPDGIDQKKFEKLLAAVFSNQGYRTALVPGWNDGQGDLRLICKESVGHIVALVQAKRCRRDLAVRLEVVQALSDVHPKESRGWLAMTSRYLPAERTFASKRGRLITLGAPNDLLRWCELVTEKLHDAR